jgi:hypothetical protein
MWLEAGSELESCKLYRFDLTTYSSASRDYTTRPCRQGQIHMYADVVTAEATNFETDLRTGHRDLQTSSFSIWSH